MSDDERDAAEPVQAPGLTALHRDVFGGDSDSDLSDAENDNAGRDESPAHRSASPSSSRSRSASASPGPQGDDYREDAPLPKIKKKSGGAGRDKSGEDGPGAGKSRKAKKRKERSEEPEDDAPMMDEKAIRRQELNRKIDDIIKTKKPKKAKKNEDDLDQFNDDIVVELKEAMMRAAETDRELVHARQPATSKLRMLKDVMSVLQQSHMAQSIVDNELLSAVKVWLEPLPDKSLPALDIQNALFDILIKMEIDTPTLKSSGLGKIILFYTKTIRPTQHIKRSAEKLLAAWSRPIIKRSSSFRTKAVPVMDLDVNRVVNHKADLKAVLKRDEEGSEKDKKRRNVRIPTASTMTYTVAPSFSQSQSLGASASQQSGEAQQTQIRRQRDQERLREMTKKLNAARSADRK